MALPFGLNSLGLIISAALIARIPRRPAARGRPARAFLGEVPAGLRASFWLSGLAVAVLAVAFALTAPRRDAAGGATGPAGTRTRRPVPGRRTTRSGGSPRR